MLRGRFQPTQGLLDDPSRRRLQLGTSFTDHPFRKRGARCNGRSTPAHLETRLDNLVALKQRRQAQQISAGRIGHVDRNRGRRELSDVARIPEMFQQQFGMHAFSTAGEAAPAGNLAFRALVAAARENVHRTVFAVVNRNPVEGVSCGRRRTSDGVHD